MEDKRRAIMVVESVFAAFAARDMEKFLSFFADDAVVEDAIPPAVRGIENMRPVLRKLLATFVEIHVEELRVFPGARSVAAMFVEVFTGADGQRTRIDGVDVFELDEQYLIRAAKSHWNQDLMRPSDRNQVYGVPSGSTSSDHQP